MKRLLFSLLVLTGTGYTTMAQAPRIYNLAAYNLAYNMPAPSGGYKADPTTNSFPSVPAHTEKQFKKNYPNAERTQWSRAEDDQWRVSCNNKGHWITLIYNDRGESYPLALPVLKNAVPNDVVTAMLERFNSVYDIAEVNSGVQQAQYLVRTFDANGQLKSWRSDAKGKEVASLEK
jgi:hypothetical protein